MTVARLHTALSSALFLPESVTMGPPKMEPESCTWSLVHLVIPHQGSYQRWQESCPMGLGAESTSLPQPKMG